MLRAESDSEGRARVAGTDDIVVLSGLATDLHRALRTERGGLAHLALYGRREPLVESFATDISDPGVLVISGTVAGTVLGFAVCRLTETRSGAWA